jgi:hypothetical protein
VDEASDASDRFNSRFQAKKPGILLLVQIGIQQPERSMPGFITNFKPVEYTVERWL